MAQASMPAKFIQLYEVQVKGGAERQYEDFVKKIAEERIR
jgi:hypothetical protein